MRINKENIEAAEKKGGENNVLIQNQGKEVGHLKSLASSARDKAQACEDAIGRMVDGKVALQPDEKPSTSGPTGGGPGGDSGSSGGGSGQYPPVPDPAGKGSSGNETSKGDNPYKNASPPDPTSGTSGGNDPFGGGPREKPPPDDSSDEESEESDNSDEDPDGDSRPVVSAPTLGKYAVVSPLTVKAAASSTDIPSPSTPSIKSDTLANVSVLDPKHPNNQDKGMKYNPFGKPSTHDPKQEGGGKDKGQHANMSVLDPMHPHNQDKGKSNILFGKPSVLDLINDSKEGQTSDTTKSETPSNEDTAKSSTSDIKTITPDGDPTTPKDSAKKSVPEPGGDGKKIQTQADLPEMPAGATIDFATINSVNVEKDKKNDRLITMSRWDPNYAFDDKLGSPPRHSLGASFRDYIEKMGGPPKKDAEKDPEKRTREDEPVSPPRKRNKGNEAE